MLSSLNRFFKTHHVNLGSQYRYMSSKEMERIVLQSYNLPKVYTFKNQSRTGTEKQCLSYPSLNNIFFSNIYWQVFTSAASVTFHLYNAFYDNRDPSKVKPVIRILAMVNRLDPKTKLRCHLWYEGSNVPVVTKVSKYRYLCAHKIKPVESHSVQPYLLDCAIPSQHRQQVPDSVSLVEERCHQVTNNLRVIHNLPAGDLKADFAVCLKGMMFRKDDSYRLVEWLELLFLLGADKIFIYDIGIHPNMTKVLRHYESRGKVDVRKYFLPGEQPKDLGAQEQYFKTIQPVKVDQKILFTMIAYIEIKTVTSSLQFLTRMRS